MIPLPTLEAVERLITISSDARFTLKFVRNHRLGKPRVVVIVIDFY